MQVTGQVQGVNFRSSTKAEADTLGLTGWVCNRPDGSVEMVMEGPKEAAQQLIAWCQRGPAWAQVEGLTVEWQAASGEFNEFEIRR